MAGVIPDDDAFRRTKRAVIAYENGDVPYVAPNSNVRSAPAFQHRLVKPDADIAEDTSGTCSVWYGATKGSETDTGDNIEAYTRQDLVEDQWCWALAMPNGWELIPLECP